MVFNLLKHVDPANKSTKALKTGDSFDTKFVPRISFSEMKDSFLASDEHQNRFSLFKCSKIFFG